MDQQTVSEVAAIVTDGMLSNKSFMNIIEQCVQKGLAKKQDRINEILDLLDSNVFDLEQKLINTKEKFVISMKSLSRMTKFVTQLSLI